MFLSTLLILGVTFVLVLLLVGLIRAVRVMEAHEEPKPNPLVQQTLALLEVTRTILSVRR